MTPQECRNLAGKHRHRAKAEPDLTKRQEILAIAAKYEALAEAIEKEGKPP